MFFLKRKKLTKHFYTGLQLYVHIYFFQGVTTIGFINIPRSVNYERNWILKAKNIAICISEVNYFHIKRRCVKGPVFVQITFGKCTPNFYFENRKDGKKMTIGNLQQFFLQNVFASLAISMQPCF